MSNGSVHPRGACAYGHTHAEAFMLMKYASDDQGVVEFIWNSRDGVTPFVVSSREGVELHHVEWHNDRYWPDYLPPLGSRIFVDLTEERAKEAALANARMFWNLPECPASQDGRWATVEDLAADLAKGYREPGAPDLIEVTG